MRKPIEADAVIVGAGPAGLFQVFELGLFGIRAHVVDSLPYPGGQPVELYPDKPIYDIPAVPRCTGRELADLLLRQIEPFKPTFHLGEEVSRVQRQADGRFVVGTSSGMEIITKTLFIAAGVGAFQPRLLKLSGIETLMDRQVFYRVKAPAHFAAKRLVILGGGDSALDWTKYFLSDPANRAESVVLVHRRNEFRATPASVECMRRLCTQSALQLVIGNVTGLVIVEGALQGLTVTRADGAICTLPLDALLVFLGLSPKLGPISEWGLEIEQKQLVVDTETFSTNVRGIFAIGDINTYPGKKKLILSGFHECALAASGAAAIIFPERNPALQYTTTSPELQQLLGVDVRPQ